MRRLLIPLLLPLAACASAPEPKPVPAASECQVVSGSTLARIDDMWQELPSRAVQVQVRDSDWWILAYDNGAFHREIVTDLQSHWVNFPPAGGWGEVQDELGWDNARLNQGLDAQTQLRYCLGPTRTAG